MSQITDVTNLEFFDHRIPIRLSCFDNNDWPVLISLWFLFQNGKIFCSTKKTSKIVQYLTKNPKCGFEIASETPPYKGIRGRGLVSFRNDITREILSSLIDRYLGKSNQKLQKFLYKNLQNEITLEITPVKIFSWNYSKRMQN